VKPDPELYGPAEVNLLRGDAAKARRVLGWTHGIGFEELVREMVLAPGGLASYERSALSSSSS
jgi:GDPmannose 4,6-dehydratase